ncbi:MAG: choice-of-anchor L domain-containing protein, partial [Myxococcaceae bacterium]|nr:choice-of-anchor L domain-containing protein [Myxococcaceae bacterium]
NTAATISTSCPGGTCLQDWYSSANPPIKAANALPETPACGVTTTGGATANDSIMLVLKMRAPTNARAFSLTGTFFSAEYPEFVCDIFNDQFVALVTTPTPTWPLPNPPDKNLATFRDGSLRYPVGINVAAGAGIFEVCEAPGTNDDCDDAVVSQNSCSAGLTLLAGTGFEKSPTFPGCALGGATRWLQVRGNVRPGEDVTIRLAIWDVGDHNYDSTALLDAFRWETQSVTPGTE